MNLYLELPSDNSFQPNNFFCYHKDIIKNKQVLIVDEVDDTRATIRKVVGEIYNIVDEWGIFVVHNKNKRKDYLVGPHVTYVACENIDGNIWIEYPWDLI